MVSDFWVSKIWYISLLSRLLIFVVLQSQYKLKACQTRHPLRSGFMLSSVVTLYRVVLKGHVSTLCQCLWPWHELSKDYYDLWPYSAERPHAGGQSLASSPWLCTWHRSYPVEERACLANRSHEPEGERERGILVLAGIVGSLKVQPQSN